MEGTASHALEAGKLQRACAGDRQAFFELYESCAPAVHALLRASLPREQCEDLQQEVFLAAWNALPRFQKSRPFRPWIYGIARNLLRQSLRETRRRKETSLDHRVLPAAAAPGPGDLSQAHRAQQILEQLQRLPEAERELLGLRLIEGLGAQEIAELIQSTPGSVRVRVHRALQKLRRLCEESRP